MLKPGAGAAQQPPDGPTRGKPQPTALVHEAWLRLVPGTQEKHFASGGLFVRYTGAPDVTYRLQRAASLTGPWSDLATNTVPASGLVEYHEASPPPGLSFYRTVQP